MISSADGEMLVALKPGHRPTADYVRALRRDLSASFPGTTFFFLPADISSQVLSFGQSAPIDVRLTGPGRNERANLSIAHDLMKRFAAIPGAVDVHLAQVTDTPELYVDVELLGGMYTQVTIAVAAALRVVQVPASAVITDARGNQVATVDGAGVVHLVAVTRGTDNGSEIDLVDGLAGGERVMVNPGGDVADGQRVHPVRTE